MSDNTTVKKPNDLVEARYNLSASQNDIIDLVLLKIGKDDFLEYEITINDYIKLFNKGKTNIYRDLKNASKEFKCKNAGFTLYNYNGEAEVDFFWFNKIIYKNNEGKIIFSISSEVKEIMLQIKNTTFYNIKYTLNMSSVYSKRIYCYLKRFEDTGYRVDKIQDLRDKLCCPKSYEHFGIFKLKVIKIAEIDINKNTDIIFTWEEIKKGNKVERIKFYITKNSQNIKKDNFEDKIKVPCKLLQSIENETRDKELLNLINQVKNIIEQDITDKDCVSILNVANNDIEKIEEKYDFSKNVNTDNIVGWLISAIKNDYKGVTGKGKNKFCNYEMRDVSKYELYSPLDAYITNGVVTMTEERKKWFIAKNKQYIEIFNDIDLNVIK